MEENIEDPTVPTVQPLRRKPSASGIPLFAQLFVEFFESLTHCSKGCWLVLSFPGAAVAHATWSTLTCPRLRHRREAEFPLCLKCATWVASRIPWLFSKKLRTPTWECCQCCHSMKFLRIPKNSIIPWNSCCEAYCSIYVSLCVTFGKLFQKDL